MVEGRHQAGSGKVLPCQDEHLDSMGSTLCDGVICGLHATADSLRDDHTADPLVQEFGMARRAQRQDSHPDGDSDTLCQCDDFLHIVGIVERLGDGVLRASSDLAFQSINGSPDPIR